MVMPGPLLQFAPPCGLRTDGTVTCAVLNDRVTPPGTFKTIAVGQQSYGCGIHTDGTIGCWANESSNLLHPSIPAGTFTRLAAADSHFCGLRSDGQIQCWDAPSSYSTPLPAMPLGTTAYANVAVGSGHVCGIKAVGTFDCWSPDPNFFKLQYQLDLVADRAFVDIFFGVAFGCGLQQDGTVLCWDNPFGIRYDTPGGRFVKIVGGAYDMCGVQADGGVVCWAYIFDAPAPPSGFACCREPFHDDFSTDPTVAGMYARSGGGWSQTDKTFSVQATGDNAKAETVFGYVQYSWRNVDARASLRVDSGAGGGITIWYGNGVGYYVGLYPTEKKVRLFSIGYPDARTVLAEADADIAMGEYLQVELSASGCKLTASVQGGATLTATADPGRFGAVGLFADNGSVLTFKSVDVACIEGAACQ
jgi:hypothetical protein